MQQLFRDAAAQVSRYAESNMVKELVKTTMLHKLVVVYRGVDMVVCEELKDECPDVCGAAGA